MKTKNIITIISFVTMLMFAVNPMIGQEEIPEQNQEEAQDRVQLPEQAQDKIENRAKERAADREHQPGNRGFVDDNGDGFNDNAIEDVSNEDVVATEGRESSQKGRNIAQENRERAMNRKSQNERGYDSFTDENGDGLNEMRFGPDQGGMPESIREKVMGLMGPPSEKGRGQNGKPDEAGPGSKMSGFGGNNADNPGPPSGNDSEGPGNAPDTPGRN